MNIILFDKGRRSFSCRDDEYKHIKNVLRLGKGDEFTAGEFNGDRGRAVITDFDQSSLHFDFHPQCDDSALYPVTLILASVRPICMKRILREVVSLGAARIIIANSELGEKSYLKSTLYTTDEYLEIMRSGAMQSGHTGLSQAVFARSVEEALALCDDSSMRILFDVDPSAVRVDELPEGDGYILAIGGERGWTDRERALFRSGGFTPVSMGKRILRSETAAVAGLSLVLAHAGLM